MSPPRRGSVRWFEAQDPEIVRLAAGALFSWRNGVPRSIFKVIDEVKRDRGDLGKLCKLVDQGPEEVRRRAEMKALADLPLTNREE